MAHPFSILHVSTFYPPWSFGGDAIYLYRLAHALADDGHQVDVAHCRDAYTLLHPDPPPAAFPAHPGVRVHDLATPVGRFAPLLAHQTGRPLLKRRQLAALMSERAYDVVHFHNVSLLGPAVLMLDAPGGRMLKIYTAHEHWLVCPTHVLWKFRREVCRQPECLRCTLHARRPPQVWRHTRLLERASRHVHQFIAPSESTAREHAERGFGPPMAVLPLFVDPVGPVDPAVLPRPHDAPYFLFVGRLEAIKGLQTLIDAWHGVPDADLLVAGSGEHERTLRALAAGDPRIRFLGHVPQQRLGALYAHAIACIIPSITFETFGIIAIESFMHATPVIARDLGSLSEIVGTSGGGILYRTSGDLYAAVERLRSNRAERDRLGRNGYRAWAERWTRAAHLRQYYTLLYATATRIFGHVPWQAARPC